MGQGRLPATHQIELVTQPPKNKFQGPRLWSGKRLHHPHTHTTAWQSYFHWAFEFALASA